MALAEPLADAGGLYATHMRTEFAGILDAMDEAFRIGRHARVPVAVSHLKCAGRENWGRSGEVLDALEQAGRTHPVGCDCLSVHRRLVHARPEAGDRRDRDHDHLVRAASRGRRSLAEGDRARVGRVAARRRAPAAARRRDLSLDVGGRRAAHPPSSGHGDRLRRPAERSEPASAPLGRLPARARPLRARRAALPARGGGAQDDRPAGAEVRAVEARPRARGLRRRPRAVRRGDGARRRDVHRSAAARRGDLCGVGERRAHVARAGGDGRARRAASSRAARSIRRTTTRHSPRRRRRPSGHERHRSIRHRRRHGHGRAASPLRARRRRPTAGCSSPARCRCRTARWCRAASSSRATSRSAT